jgi:hypothetical protein
MQQLRTGPIGRRLVRASAAREPNEVGGGRDEPGSIEGSEVCSVELSLKALYSSRARTEVPAANCVEILIEDA